MSGATKPITAQPSALTPEAIDLDGLLKRLHLPTIRRRCPDVEERAEVKERAELEEISHRAYLAVLVAEEVAHRVQTRIQRATRKAQFPFLRTIEEFDSNSRLPFVCRCWEVISDRNSSPKDVP